MTINKNKTERMELVVYSSVPLEFVRDNTYPFNNASSVAKEYNCSLNFRRTTDRFNNKGTAALVVGENIENLELARDIIHQKYGVKPYFKKVEIGERLEVKI